MAGAPKRRCVSVNVWRWSMLVYQVPDDGVPKASDKVCQGWAMVLGCPRVGVGVPMVVAKVFRPRDGGGQGWSAVVARVGNKNVDFFATMT